MNRSSRAFQVPNKVITKEDITPLSRSHVKKTDPREVTDGDDGLASAVEATPIIITTARSIDTAGSLSKKSTGDEGAQETGVDQDNNGDDGDDDEDLESTLGYSSEPDPLFSPCHQPSVTNNTFAYGADNETPLEEDENRKGFHTDSESSLFLPQLQQSFFFGACNTDFWKEVNGTAEEAICLQDTRQRKSSLVALHPGDATPGPDDTLGIEDFINDDINGNEAGSSTSASSASSSPCLFDNLDYNIKLLCYRDNEGKFTLKKRKFLKTSLRSSSTISKKWKPVSKRDKLLKRAIRRKSGVCETLSTGFGIGEFML
ncbi:hypothetical protein SEUBUCD646_0G03370 [Saccharomyces eubayanus]|uniref:YGR079W-like protein n=1 Tax=Saccharomyces eubayanus TaxID=1080349 RepID=A0ABN8VQ56_SACEU|nr:hypothetical protein SEUBUCD650_0G03350 [Saccharomyces eubayanus]CAI2023617.1 hypothetical protein SEUBUCD646_0G03370 [Saccharomyces eubayanus]